MDSEIMYTRRIVLVDAPIPPDLKNRRGQLLRWLANTLGLLSGKGEDVVVDVLDGLFYYNVKKGYPPSLEELITYVNRKRRERGESVVAAEAVRYHIRKMETLGVIERTSRRSGKIVFKHWKYGTGTPKDFVMALRSDVQDILRRVEEAVDALVSLYEI